MKKDVENETIFKLNRLNFALEIGAGCDFYFEYFKFAPQIKYSYGLKNLIVEDGTIYTSPLEGFYTRGFQISLTFEYISSKITYESKKIQRSFILCF